VELDDRFWKPRFNLGVLYLQQKRMAEAVPLLERAVELAPADPLIAVHLGHAYSGRARAAEAAGKKEEALADKARANTVWCRASQLGSIMGELLCFKK
jgi:Flp pilus assembly protein TadD